MRQRALQARADGRWDDAAALWRQMLRRTPDDWRVALELRTDLASAWHYSESDPAFRRAARSLPDEEWLAHYSKLFTFHSDDLPWLAKRARDVLGRQPANLLLHRLLGDILFQWRHWAGAEAHYAKASPSAEIAMKQAVAGLYRRLKRLPAEGGPGFEIAFINLDRNVARQRRVRRDFKSAKASIFRIAGVEGKLLPEPAVRRLADDDAVTMRGTLGCFLSHASAWETMLARGLSHCLIVEDDAMPLLPLPATLGFLGLPPDYDVCFVNDRLQPRWTAERIARSKRWEPVPFAEAFATFPPEDNAPGADGYLLSASGARKLLAWVEEDGFAQDVDWRLMTYGLTAAEYDTLPRHSHAWGVIDTLRHLVKRTDRLQAYVLHPALIRTIPISSDREDDNRHRRI